MEKKRKKRKKQIYSESPEAYRMIQWVFCPVSLEVASCNHEIVTVRVILSAYLLGSVVKSRMVN